MAAPERSWPFALACALLTGACAAESPRHSDDGERPPDAGGGAPSVQAGPVDPTPEASAADPAPGDAGRAEAGDVPDSSDDDPDPVFTEEVLTALRALRYDSSPFDADPSNRFGDDPGAQALGQILFFDPSMSGRLLES